MINNIPYIVVNKNNEPYFNMALEEYLLKKCDGSYFMLWRNEPCIVIGRNQNTIAEINSEYVKKQRLKVVRRLSGGGAVFHDLGNLNFTFITDDTKDGFYNFYKFTNPIIEFLGKLGIEAELSGRNDLIITSTKQKFSGNAQYKHESRLLHHGTILFSANVNKMTAALRVNALKLDSKGVQSVSSRVTNIQSHLNKPLTIEAFEKKLLEYITSKQFYTTYNLTQIDKQKITKLIQDKYATWEWNYGNSPDYNIQNRGQFAGGSVEVTLKVENKIIKNIRITGDFFSKHNINTIEKALTGARYQKAEIMAIISQFKFQDYIVNVSCTEFAQLLFQ